jgi:phosphohistidine phosphatase
MDILVVRHGRALEREAARTLGVLDRDRPLTWQGRSRMKEVARGLAGCVPGVSALITSPLRRALETAEILQQRYEGLRLVESDSLLPEADPAELGQFLGDAAFDSTALVVGHEPHLGSWVSWCVSGETRSMLELRKGGACLLRFEGVLGPGQGRLLWLLTPSVSRRL